MSGRDKEEQQGTICRRARNRGLNRSDSRIAFSNVNVVTFQLQWAFCVVLFAQKSERLGSYLVRFSSFRLIFYAPHID